MPSPDSFLVNFGKFLSHLWKPADVSLDAIALKLWTNSRKQTPSSSVKRSIRLNLLKPAEWRYSALDEGVCSSRFYARICLPYFFRHSLVKQAVLICTMKIPQHYYSLESQSMQVWNQPLQVLAYFSKLELYPSEIRKEASTFVTTP